MSVCELLMTTGPGSGIGTEALPAGPRAVGAASDEALLALHLEGAEGAFGELLERHQPWVWRYLRNRLHEKEAADDLAQEVFLRVARAAASFRRRAKLSSWIFSIATNVLRSHEARARRERFRRVSQERLSALLGRGPEAETSPEDAFEAVPDEAPGPERELAGRQQVERLRRALGGLSERRRRVLLLVKVEGLSLEEAAGLLDMKLNTVKTTLHRARLELARALAEGAIS